MADSRRLSKGLKFENRSSDESDRPPKRKTWARQQRSGPCSSETPCFYFFTAAAAAKPASRALRFISSVPRGARAATAFSIA